LDRIDIHIEVPWVDYDKLSSDRLGEPSAATRERVEAARDIQRRRFEGTELACNADMGPAEVRQYCEVDQAGKSLLRAAMQQLAMSARAYHRILKLARAIADLAHSERIETAHPSALLRTGLTGPSSIGHGGKCRLWKARGSCSDHYR
jgi:magnesium chelatase family protein